jgi:hypothetical protein
MGFVLGTTAGCPYPSACSTVLRTSDGGGSWVRVAAPPVEYVGPNYDNSPAQPDVSEIRFADPLDGWAYGPALWATHNGAAGWKQVNLDGTVVSLETAGGYVDAVVSPCQRDSQCRGALRLEQASATGGPFTTVLTGPPGQLGGVDAPDLTLHPPVGFAILGHGMSAATTWLYATGSLADPRGWNRFPDPCSGQTELTSMIAPNSTLLYSLCLGVIGLGSTKKFVFVTDDGRATEVGSAPTGGDGGMLTATASGTLVIASASGASELYRSTDGGRTWATAETYFDGGAGFNDLGFTTGTQGVVIHGQPNEGDGADQLLMTHDAGATWQPVSFG